nr:restriction endonuclease subunit S [Acinetobacter indicus]
MAVPKLRFKEFDGDWSPYVLKDFVSFRKGKGISKADISENGINECIRYGELYTTYGQVIDHIHSKTNVSKSECILSKAGDVIIPASGETQIDIATASCVLHDDIILSGDLNILSHEENGSWLAYYLSSAKKLEIAQLAQGNSVVHLYSSQLKDLKINKPSKEEQTKIASFLSNVDEKISQLTQKHDLLSQYKQGMMQKLFSQQLRFKADDGSEFGEWESRSLGDTVTTMQSGLSRQLHDEDIGLVVLRSNNVIDNKVSFDDVKFWYLNDPQGADVNNYLLDDGDILVNFINSMAQIGKSAIYRKTLDRKVICTTNILRIKADQTKVTSEFLNFIFQTNEYQNYIQSITKPAVNQASFTTKEFKMMIFKIPCLEEQTKIANFLSAIDQKIEVVAQQIEQAKQWKKGLLQQMFV